MGARPHHNRIKNERIIHLVHIIFTFLELETVIHSRPSSLPPLVGSLFIP